MNLAFFVKSLFGEVRAFVLAHGASTQPFCMHARALTQANVSGTRVWLYLLQHARARERAAHSTRHEDLA